MKHIFLSFLFLITAVGFINAQEHAKDFEKREPISPKEEYKQLKKELNLSKTQKKELKEIYNYRQEEFEAMQEHFSKDSKKPQGKGRPDFGDGNRPPRPNFNGRGKKPERPNFDDEDEEKPRPDFEKERELSELERIEKEDEFRYQIKSILNEKQYKKWQDITKLNNPRQHQ